MTQVLIAAPSAVERAGLEALLAASPGLAVIGAFADLSAIDALRPEVVLAAMPLERLSPAAGGHTPAFVLLTGEDQPAWTPEALRLGVHAVLPRGASAAAIVAAVETAAAGLAVVDPHELGELLGTSAAPLPVAEGNGVLTARETEVLRMMADGAANKEIAWKLGISEHTVKFHVTSILGKLNAGSRTEAVTRGFRKGLILI